MNKAHLRQGLLVLLWAVPVWGWGQSLDEALDGFESEPPAEMEAVLEGFDSESLEVETQSPARLSPWSGAWILSAAYQTDLPAPAAGEPDYRGLSRARAKLQWQWQRRLSESWQTRVNGFLFYDGVFAARERERVPDEVLAAYEREAELQEAWLRYQGAADWELKLGRQIVVWGKSDLLRVTDVLNPIDNLDPGMADVADLRLPVTMARWDHYFNDWTWSLMWIPEIRADKRPPVGSLFGSDTPLPPQELPADGVDNAEWATALSGVFQGWDAAFYAAEIYQDLPRLDAATTTLVHDRVRMLGAAWTAVSGSWLWKAELAHWSELRFTQTPTPFQRVDLLLGAEYSGFSEQQWGLEWVRRQLRDYQPILAGAPDNQPETEDQIALRYRGDFLHQRLNLQLAWLLFGTQHSDGGFQRLVAEYELDDGWLMRAGYINYDSGQTPQLTQIGRLDRLFVESQWSF